jgi:hypothetical protein
MYISTAKNVLGIYLGMDDESWWHAASAPNSAFGTIPNSNFSSPEHPPHFPTTKVFNKKDTQKATLL